MNELQERIEELEEQLENAKIELELKDERINQLEEYIEEYTNPKSPYDLVGMSEKDFV